MLWSFCSREQKFLGAKVPVTQSTVLAMFGWVVRPSVCHTLAISQNDASQDHEIFTDGQPKDSNALLLPFYEKAIISAGRTDTNCIISAVPTHKYSIISGRKNLWYSISCLMAVVLAWFDMEHVLIDRNPAI